MAPKVSVDTLKRRRADIKARLTNYQTFLSLMEEQPELYILKVKVEALQTQFADLSNIHESLIELDGDFADEHLEERNGLEEQYFMLLANSHRLIKQCEVAVTSSIIPPVPVATKPQAPIKLPEVSLPKFDGNVENWFSFKDKFIARIHSNCNIDDVDKLQYLYSCLSDKASRAIDSLEGTGENYLEAWNILNAKYDNTRRAILRHWTLLNQVPKLPRDTPEALEELVDTFKQHLRALKSLGEPVENWDTCIIFLLTSKISNSTKYQWETTLPDNKMPSYTSLLNFLEKRGNCAEQLHYDIKPFFKKHEFKGPVSRGQIFVANIQKHKKENNQGSCPVCKNSHSIFKCNLFRGMSINQRRQAVAEANLCYNCFGFDHFSKNCKSGTCRLCNAKHNTFLHPLTVNPNSTTAPVSTPSNSTTNPNSEQTPSASASSSVVLSLNTSDDILPTAVVNLSNNNNTSIVCRAIIDTGSTRNFMTEDLASMLNLQKEKCHISIGALNQLSTVAKYSVKATIKSRINDFRKTLEFLIVPQITTFTPEQTINRKNINVPKNIKLADPEFHKPAPVQLLLGSSTALSTLCVGQIVSSSQDSDLIFQKTQLGWIIGGNLPLYGNTSRAHCHFTNLDSDISRFWEIEQDPPIKYLSEEEQSCEKHFQENTTRDSDGRYAVSLPFNDNKDKLGETYQMALKRLQSLERKLRKDEDLKAQYAAVIEDHLQRGYMTQVTNQEEKGFYLPHQAVLKESSLTTKVRVVFDASAISSTGISLNDALLAGPIIQDDIFPLLLRFRLHQHVLTGDIEKMYLQIKINKNDQPYLRMLWKKEDDSVVTYQFNRLIFGLKPASYLATRSLHQLAEDEKARYPQASLILKRDLYVDDLLTGADTVEEIVQIKEDITELLQSGGFNLRQCASNTSKVLSTITDHNINLHLQSTDTIKTLGIHWNSSLDKIIYTVVPTFNQRITKRNIFSEVAKIFDPLGLLNPVVVIAKLLIQELWKIKIDWDESLPTDLHTRWKTFASQLFTLNEISFDRKMLCEQYNDIQLHGFCDASEKAYGACIYIRSVDINNRIQVKLYCAKSRVSPVKNVQTIPRLELCAALLLSHLYNTVSSSIHIPINRTVLWTDSLIVLRWINTSPHLLQTFVANRVSNIRTKTNVEDWRHVRTHHNPADLISRGVLPKDFKNNLLWTNGPQWLSKEEEAWPHNDPIITISVPEMRKTVCLVSNTLDSSLFLRYSSFVRLQRVVAFILRFKPAYRKKGFLTTDELQFASNRILNLVQQAEFTAEYKSLRNGQNLSQKSRLLSLNPFIGSDGLIRVGGRLHHSTLSHEQKHPIIIPKSHHVTKLIIKKAHFDNLHGGLQSTLNALRQTYWPIDGRNQVRGVIRKCVRCSRFSPIPVNYIMGSLPKVRVSETRPFCNVGIDYCGPFLIKEKAFRNRNKIKIYVAVFVCLVTKAVHLEVASDLTADGFLSVLKRFISRRGMCASIYSDNGTNFIGANRELQELQSLFDEKSYNEQINNFLTQKGIIWHFNPPGSPHFGGIWEAAVKSLKHHLRRVVGPELFNYEQFNTLIIEIECILNSRPLTPISSDPNDLSALTPAHFLIGDSFTSLPEQDLISTPMNRLSTWKHIQKVKQDFWSRWSKEYINQLNVRNKWIKGDHSIKVGSIVLIRETNLPPLQWRLGRVLATYPGQDGVVRTVRVKTANCELVRAVKVLAPLPVDSE